jgi:hypothetical protein
MVNLKRLILKKFGGKYFLNDFGCSTRITLLTYRNFEFFPFHIVRVRCLSLRQKLSHELIVSKGQ